MLFSHPGYGPSWGHSWLPSAIFPLEADGFWDRPLWGSSGLQVSMALWCHGSSLGLVCSWV